MSELVLSGNTVSPEIKEIEFKRFSEMVDMLTSYSDVIKGLNLSDRVIFLYTKDDINKLISDERYLAIEPLRKDIENLSKIYSNKILLDYFFVLTEKLDKISSDFISNFVSQFYTQDKLQKIEEVIENDIKTKIEELSGIVDELKTYYEEEKKRGFNKKEWLLIAISILLVLSSIFLITTI